jgi:hypothetical protein
MKIQHDITDDLDCWLAYYTDSPGEIEGVYCTQKEAERSTMGLEHVALIRMVPCEQVVV